MMFVRANQKGFTLLELMMTLLIIGILAGIAMAAYGPYVERARRADATSALLEITQSAERFYSSNNTYTGFTLQPNQAQSPEQGTAAYNIRLVINNGGEGFAVTATPTGRQSNDPCGNLATTETGARTRTGSEPINKCW